MKTTRIALLAALLFLGVCGVWQTRLAARRTAMGLPPGDTVAGTPPMVTLTTVMLGGFRGLLADVLWLRATHLQDQGRYFELVQLADWITKLEPHSTLTWGFQAWNMAYNISAMMSEPAERWQWVQNGIRLLRDDALRYNPRDARLHFELGWIFQHKIGTEADKMAPYFLQRLAVEVDALLPGGELTGVPAGAGTAAALRQQFGLDPAEMARITASVGPLDWRLPETHAIYWADQGLRASGDAQNLLCVRMRTQCLAHSFFAGRLTLNPGARVYRREPRPELLDSVLRTYHEVIRARSWGGAQESYSAFLTASADTLDTLGRPADAARVRTLLAQQPR
jgi:hypothetical protein